MGKYAVNTPVPVSETQADIKETLNRYGASGYMYAEQDNQAFIAFVMNEKQVRFLVNLPRRDLREFTHTVVRGLERTKEDAIKAWEQACRQIWRALYLVIKAKLEAVEAGISIFEEEFMAHIVLPDGHLVKELLVPQIEQSYSTGVMPPLLPIGR